MAANDRLLVDYRKTLAVLLNDIKSFESFQRTKFGAENEKRVDVTAKWVQDLRCRANGLAGIIRVRERGEGIDLKSKPK